MIGLGLAIMMGLGFGAALISIIGDSGDGEGPTENALESADGWLGYISLTDDDGEEEEEETQQEVAGETDEGNTDGDSDDQTDGNEDTEEAEGQRFLISAFDDVTGTDGDDVFVLSKDYEEGKPDHFDRTENSTTLTGGAGDDIINVAGVFYDPAGTTDPAGNPEMHVRSSLGIQSIFGEDGNDVILANGEDMLLSGGKGDDVIASGYSAESSIYGGPGNDSITVWDNSYSDTTVFGGDGDDTIDARGIGYGYVQGGDGNDTILIHGNFELPGVNGHHPFPSHVDVRGGHGDDTIEFRISASSDFYQIPKHFGGPGADTFDVSLSEGIPVNEYYESTEAQPGEDPKPSTVLSLPDFTPGEDTLHVDLSYANDGSSVSDVTLETVDSENSLLTITYELNGYPIRDVMIEIGAADVTMDDIEIPSLSADILPS